MCCSWKIEEESTGLVLRQVIPEYYGFPIYDDYTHREKFQVMIPRNTVYPNTREFSTNCYLVRKTDGSYIDWADVDLYQSPDGTLGNAKCLNPFGFSGATPSSQAIKVIYTLDRNGFINVEIIQTCDGRILLQKEKVVEIKVEEKYVEKGADDTDSDVHGEYYEEEVPEPDFLPLPQRREVLPPSPPERHALPSPPAPLERFPFQLPEVPRDALAFPEMSSDSEDIVISEDSDL